MTCGTFSNVGYEINALFSGDVYNKDSKLDPDGVWSRLTGIDDFQDSKNGFFAAAYRNKDTGEIVVAYRGTDDPNDAKPDLVDLPLNQLPNQYDNALKFYDNVAKAYGDAKISITGHSLGGALASLVGAVKDKPVDAYNAPGVSALLNDPQIARYVNGDYSKINNYNAKNDIVHNLPPWASQLGQSHDVDVHTQFPWITGMLVGMITGNPAVGLAFAKGLYLYDQHSIDNLFSAIGSDLNCDYPQPTDPLSPPAPHGEIQSPGPYSESLGFDEAAGDVFGSPAEDHLIGASLDDMLLGGARNDYLQGSLGSDWLNGGEDNDALFGSLGNDFLVGEEGDDYLEGNEGKDYLIGGGGSDTLYGGSGDDYLWGEDANAVVAGNDYIDGGDGNDAIDGGVGDDHLLGGAGDDLLIGDDGNDYLEGGDGNDVMFGGACLKHSTRTIKDELACAVFSQWRLTAWR